MVNRKIIAFYSPYPGAGKTTAAKSVWREAPRVRLMSATDEEAYKDIIEGWGFSMFHFSSPIKSFAHHIMNIAMQGRKKCLDKLTLIAEKDTPLKTLNKKTMRDLYIAIA